jgi:uncharacterized small protein (DUF1192 family)
MSILETLEEIADSLRGSHPATRQGIDTQTLQVATQYNSSLKQHFKYESEDDELVLYSNDHALAQARKEMTRLKEDIARLKAQLQES